MKESDDKKEKKRSWEIKEKKKRVRKEKVIEIKRKKEYNSSKSIKFSGFRLFCSVLTFYVN